MVASVIGWGAEEVFAARMLDAARGADGWLAASQSLESMPEDAFV